MRSPSASPSATSTRSSVTKPYMSASASPTSSSRSWNIKKQKITLYSVNDALRSKIREAFKGHAYKVLEVTDSKKLTTTTGANVECQAGTVGRLALPDKVDAVVTASALNSRTEGLAATLGLKQGRNDVYVIVIPEALDYLRDMLARRGELVLVGADQAK